MFMSPNFSVKQSTAFCYNPNEVSEICSCSHSSNDDGVKLGSEHKNILLSGYFLICYSCLSLHNGKLEWDVKLFSCHCK